MFRKLLVFLFFLSLFFLIPQAHAQQQVPQPIIPQQSYVKGKVIEIVKEGIKDEGGTKNLYQILKVQLLEGKEQGKTITVQQGGEFALTANQKAKIDSTVIVMISKLPQQQETYAIYDTFRLNWAIGIVLSLFAFIMLIAGKRGIGATAGLLISLLIIWLFIIPEILGGGDPLFICVIWSCVILLITTYVAHGISKATTLAIASTFVSLFITILLSILFVNVAHLAGLGNEDAVTLQFNQGVNIDLKGLLLGGIIIGTLGALNDVTTTQVATIFALAKTGAHKSKFLLAEQSFLVGTEHIISLVNTLVLAYAGSSLVVFIFLQINPNHLPYWVILNSEPLIEELVRTAAGSFGLILAVPLATLLGVIFAPKVIQKKIYNEASIVPVHAH